MSAAWRLLAALGCAALLLAGGAATAAEIKVLTAGALKPVMLAMAPEFERQTGHRLRIDNDTAGALGRRIAAGEAYDVAILTPAFIAPLLPTGHVVASSVTPVARVGIGVAVRAGAPLPDISTPAAFRQALLSARSIAWIDPAAGGSSGIYMAGVYERMGIAAQVKAKSVLVPGGLTAQRLVTGEADLAVQQMSELLVVPGVALVGPIPAEMQNYTTYSAVMSPAARDAAAARQFLDALVAAPVRDMLHGMGMNTP